MGYIHEFENKLNELLADVDDETRNAVVKTCKQTCLESFRNGITAAKAGDVRKDAERKTRAFARGKTR